MPKAQQSKLIFRDQVVIPKLSVAKSFQSRLVGLLNHDQLSQEEALWILPGNSIHTWFMRFPIDCVFLSKDLQVISIHSVQPWKLIGPQWGARSVIEMQFELAKKIGIKKGDYLHVGT